MVIFFYKFYFRIIQQRGNSNLNPDVKFTLTKHDESKLLQIELKTSQDIRFFRDFDVMHTDFRKIPAYNSTVTRNSHTYNNYNYTASETITIKVSSVLFKKKVFITYLSFLIFEARIERTTGQSGGEKSCM